MDETKKRLLRAESVEEVAQILKDAGDDEANAENVWQEACRLREQDGKDLSLDELDAVAGGMGGRSWYEEGCAATVEPGSNCSAVDGGCFMFFNNYNGDPIDQPCIFCPARYTTSYTTILNGQTTFTRYYACRECGKDFFMKDDGTWSELYHEVPW